MNNSILYSTPYLSVILIVCFQLFGFTKDASTFCLGNLSPYLSFKYLIISFSIALFIQREPSNSSKPTYSAISALNTSFAQSQSSPFILTQQCQKSLLFSLVTLSYISCFNSTESLIKFKSSPLSNPKSNNAQATVAFIGVHSTSFLLFSG